jgi:hypothetical protein
VLLLLLAAQASAVLGETLGVDHQDVARHSEGAAPGHDDGPCGPSCPCACCPGQSVSKAVCTVAPVLHIMASQAPEPIGVVDLHPADTAVGIFHPPRA